MLFFAGTDGSIYLQLKCGGDSCETILDTWGNSLATCTTDTLEGDILNSCENFICTTQHLELTLRSDTYDEWFGDWVE